MTLSLLTEKAALVVTLAAMAIAGGAGCVTTNLPSSSHIASSEAAIRSARDLGAERVPDAAVHLELAQRQLDRARRYMRDDDADDARWMLLRAEADAHLALALTREARSREAAEEMAARVRDLTSAMHASSPEAM